MRKHSRQFVMAAGLGLSGAYLLAGSGTGCINFAAERALQTADFCFIFDCQNGALGGVLQPCVTAGAEPVLFTDCPFGP